MNNVLNYFYTGKFLRILVFFFSLTISGCDMLLEEEEDDTDYDSSIMCYTESGNYLTVSCTYEFTGTCGDSGESTLAYYSTYSDCAEDIENVLDRYRNSGQVRPGPLSISGGGNGGGGGDTPDCGLEGYNGPEFDIQVDAQCKAAYMYDCVGDFQARDASCTLYYDYGNAVWVGSDPLPACPYCD